MVAGNQAPQLHTKTHTKRLFTDFKTDSLYLSTLSTFITLFYATQISPKNK